PFFFSSRRRHTRWPRDWSSDVCSSDLTEYAMVDRDDDLRIGIKTSAITLGRADVAVVMCCYAAYLAIWAAALYERIPSWAIGLKIGRASCRERGESSGVGGGLRGKEWN